MDHKLTVRRRARSTWSGTVPEGAGRIALHSGAFEGDFTLHGRVDDDVAQTSPEELIGAAQAGCFTMSLADLLSEAGHPPTTLETTAMVQLEQQDSGFAITQIVLKTVGDVPGIEAARFEKLAEQAKATCPVSLALAGTEISVTAKLGSA